MDSLIITSVTGASTEMQTTPNNHQQLRKDLNEAIDDRDRLFKILERRSLEIERLEGESKMLKSQLQSAIEGKCESLAKYEELGRKCTEIDFKERRMETEKQLMSSQVEMLEADLKRNVDELKQCRMESSARIFNLEGKLHEKCEELNIAVMQSSQLRETNESLVSRVDELSQQILNLNENFSQSMKKYQNELNSKTRLVELYKEKNDDCVNEQSELTSAISEMRNALKEATDEYGKLETKFKASQLSHENEIESLNQQLNQLKNELKNANELLHQAHADNIEIAVEKTFPSAKRARHSISEVYSLYVHANEDFESLTLEHEQLKHQYTQVVDEIKDKAPIIRRTQVELSKLKEAHAELMANYETIKSERLDAQGKIEMLMMEVENNKKIIREMQQDRFDLKNQVCQLLSVIENRKIYTRNGDFISDKVNNFKSIEELQENNLKLIKLVRELSAAVEELEKLKCQCGDKKQEEIIEEHQNGTEIIENDQNKLQITHIESNHIEVTENDEKKAENDFSAIAQQLTILQSTIDAKEVTIKSLKSQLDKLHSTHNEISQLNFKLKSQIEHQESQIKLQQKNFEITKRKNQSLEDKIKNSSLQNVKLETSLSHIRDELKNATSKLSNAENRIERLTKENKMLIKSEAQLKGSNDAMNKSSQLQTHMMSSIEMIKATMERIEIENGSKMNEKCEQLEKALNDERNTLRDLEAQANAEIEQLENEIKLMHSEIQDKDTKIVELTAEIEKFTQKSTKDEEVQSDSSESDQEMAKLKDNVSQLRKIGKRYKEQYLELKLQLENSSKSEEIENLQKKNSELMDALKKENSVKELLTKARKMITRLSEEKEQLSEELKKLKNESFDGDFVSCIASSVDLKGVESNLTIMNSSINESGFKMTEHSTEIIKNYDEIVEITSKTSEINNEVINIDEKSTKKRQRENENGENAEIDEEIEISEKRMKIEVKLNSNDESYRCKYFI